MGQQVMITRKDEGYDSIAWAFEVWVKTPDQKKIKSAVIHGDETCPAKIEFYAKARPLITDLPAFVWVAEVEEEDSPEPTVIHLPTLALSNLLTSAGFDVRSCIGGGSVATCFIPLNDLYKIAVGHDPEDDIEPYRVCLMWEGHGDCEEVEGEGEGFSCFDSACLYLRRYLPRKVVLGRDHPSNLDRTARLVYPLGSVTLDSPPDVYEVSGGFLAYAYDRRKTGSPSECFEELFPTLERAQRAQREHIGGYARRNETMIEY